MLLEKLANNSLFNHVSADYLQSMVSNRTEVNLDAGEFLFHQGDMGRGMYILVDGKVDIVLESAETREVIKILATLEPGAYLGEVCMLSPQERTAGVRAQTKVKLMYMDSRDFLRDIDDKDPNALRISHNLALTLTERLKRANEIVTSLSITPEEKDDISGALF